jgi:hypothetical protein
MRAHVVTEYDSVLDVLNEPGCPICVFLRNAQADLVQNTEISDDPWLCNFHGWSIAAVRDTGSAARILLSALDNRPVSSQLAGRECVICTQLHPLEDLALTDLRSSERQGTVHSWLKAGGAFCVIHGAKVKANAPLRLAALVDEADARKRRELKTALGLLLSKSKHHQLEHSGLLGRVAEYLVSQRGLSF